MSRPPRPLALLGLALLGLADALSTRAAAADSPAATPSAAPTIVLLAPELDRSDVDDRAVGTLGARVRAAGIQVVVVRRPVPELHALAGESKALITTWGARGALWVDIGRSAALYLVTRDSEQVFGRTIPAPEGKTSATLETLANIAASVAEELLEGRIVELSPVKVPDPPPERTASVSGPPVAGEPVREASPKPPVKTEIASPAPPPPTKPRQASPDSTAAPPLPSADADRAPRFPRIGLSVGYTGDTFGAHVPWQSAVSALLTLAPSPSAFLNLGYDVVIPTHVRGVPAGYDLARHPIVALGGYRFPVSSWDFRLGARMAMDLVEQTLDPFEPPPPPPGAPPLPPRPPIRSEIQILFTAGPALEVGYLFADRFRASAFLGVEFLLNRPSPTFPILDLRADPVRLITGLSLGVDLFVPEARSRPRSASAEPPKAR